MKIPKNEGPADRTIRITTGILLLALGLFVLDALQPTTAGLTVSLIGAFSLVTGLTGRCIAYIPFGINTARSTRHASPVH